MRSLIKISQLLSLSFLTLIISACQKPSLEGSESTKYELQKLKLRQNKPDGKLHWELSSIETKYDTNKSIIYAKNPEIILYKNGMILIILNQSTNQIK